MKYKDPEWLEETYENHSTPEMAEMCDVCTSTICKYMEKHDIDRATDRHPKDGKHKDRDWLEEKYVNEKLSQKEISDIVGVGKSTIKYWLEKHNIPIRDKSEAAELRAEKHPHTLQNYPQEFVETNSWDLWDDDKREEFREWLSEERKGEDNPMSGVTGEDHHRWKQDKPNHRFYQTDAWREVRREALDKAEHQCEVCGETEKLVGHHVIPLSDGGEPLDVDNVAILCRSCHMEWEGLYLRPDNRE